jgi:peroxiredoxin
MEKLLFAIAFLLTGISPGFSQSSAPVKQDTSHHKVQVDANPAYLDESGQKIEKSKFISLLKDGQYSFGPKMENGKIIAFQLKKNEKLLRLGNQAPEFTVIDRNGKTYKLSGLRGKTVVLNFWFTACTPCIQEMPELNQLTEEFKNDPDVVFLAITYDPDDRVEGFLSKNTFKYPIVTGQKPLIEQYGIVSYPTNLIIDKNGNVAFLLSAYSPDNVKKLATAIHSLEKI